MPNLCFRHWLLDEGRDIFGFSKDFDPVLYDPRKDEPMRPYNIEETMQYLATNDLDTKSARMKFMNEVRWGDGPGSIRVGMNTRLSVIIERQSRDLLGDPRWFTVRMFQVDRTGYGGNEVRVANEILDQVKWLDKQPLPSASESYDDFENLVVAMGGAIRRTARPCFIYEGIRKVNDTNYIIRLGLRGHGVEAPHQRRVFENHTHVIFSKETGTIRVFNHNIESPVGGSQSWGLMEADTDWNFAPNQARDEIIEAVANTMHWY
jgi:hypothetical protein